MSQESYERIDLPLDPGLSITPPALTSSQKAARAPVAPAPQRAVRRLPPELRSTFLARAREDHAACRAIVRGLTFFKESRRKIPALLQRSIEEAERLGHDEGLHATYLAISQMMAEWWWVDNLRATINNTLTALAENTVTQRLSNAAQLADKVHRLTREVADRDATIEALKASNAQHAKRYQEIKQRADQQAIALQENKKSIAALEGKLNDALTKIDAIVDQQSQQNTPETASQKHYDPRLLTGGLLSCNS